MKKDWTDIGRFIVLGSFFLTLSVVLNLISIQVEEKLLVPIFQFIGLMSLVVSIGCFIAIPYFYPRNQEEHS